MFCGGLQKSLPYLQSIRNPAACFYQLRPMVLSACWVLYLFLGACAIVCLLCEFSWRQYSRLLPLFTVIYRYGAIYPAVLKFFSKKNENSEKIPVILILDNRCPFVHGMFHTKSISETTIFYPKGEFEL